MYRVKEIFESVQGEGMHAGRVAVFCRFAGCNLWSGRESDRASAICRFCDTDFLGGERHATAADLAAAIWAVAGRKSYVVLTGGEPTLQADAGLVATLRAAGHRVAIETNGTRDVPAGIDWIAVSPKAGAEVVQRSGHELKLVWPQDGIDPAELLRWRFSLFYLQPRDGPDREANTGACLDYVARHPRWRLSLQIHKTLGVR